MWKNRDVHPGQKLNRSCDDVMMKVFLPAGAERFRANIRHMTGKNPLFVFKLCWKYLTPAVCTVRVQLSYFQFWSKVLTLSQILGQNLLYTGVKGTGVNTDTYVAAFTTGLIYQTVQIWVQESCNEMKMMKIEFMANQSGRFGETTHCCSAASSQLIRSSVYDHEKKRKHLLQQKGIDY